LTLSWNVVQTEWVAVLLERDSALSALHAAAAAACAGRGRVVVVEGEAGIGKSSLLRAFLGGLGEEFQMLAGGCDDLLAPRALAPLRDAVRATPGPLASSLDGPADAVLDAAVAQLSGPRPAVLVVEDVHWADDATLDVLRHLTRRMGALPAVLVISMRTEPLVAGHPAQALLGALAVVDGVVRLPLDPLSAGAVARMAAAVGRDGAMVHRVSSGNPFFVTETLAAPAGALPDSVADAVRARLSGLDAGCLAALEQLAVVPTVVDTTLAKALLGDRLDDLEAAEERGIVEVRPGGLAFRHELARRAVEAGLAPLRRRALHAAVVRALRELGADDPERLVHHAVAAGHIATITEFAPRAARDAAAGGSHRQALAHLEAAVPHAARLDPVARCRLIDDHGWQLYIAQRFADAVVAGREAVHLAVAAGRSDLEIEATVRLSRYLLMCGETDEAEALRERLVAAVHGGMPAALVAGLAVHNGAFLVLTGRLVEAGPVLREALERATEAGRPDLRSLALNYRGLVRGERGEVDEAVADVREAVAVARAHGSHEAAARGYTNLSEVLYILGRRAELIETVAEARVFCENGGLAQFTILLDLMHHMLLVHDGEWDAAERGLRVLSKRAASTKAFAPKVDAWLGRLLARMDRDGARELVLGAWREARRQQQLISMLYAGLAVAEWAWLAGEPEAAREVAEALLPRIATPGWSHRRHELTRYLALAGLPVEPQGPADGAYERAVELGWSAEPGPMMEGWSALDALGADAPARLVRQRLRDRGVTRFPRRRAEAAAPSGLTSRQLDVLAHLRAGATNAEIAERLGLSIRTIDHHVAAILGRLGVRSRKEAVAATRGR
jgi:DNA-binding CsgD family transcriptional regulator/tetratricopeptide (TPR) repeat protein